MWRILDVAPESPFDGAGTGIIIIMCIILLILAVLLYKMYHK